MQNPINPMQLFQQFRSNPLSFFARRRWNIPQEMMNDPDAMVDYLLKTKQIDQNQVNAAYSQMSQYRR